MKYFDKNGLKATAFYISLLSASLTLLIRIKSNSGLSLLQVVLIGVVFMILVVPFFSYWQSRQLKRQVPLNVMKLKIEREIKQISNLLNHIENPSDLFKLKFIAYRFKLEFSKYENMQKGAYRLWCLDKMAYFMYIFRSAIDMLHEGDEYRAVTTPETWIHDRPIGGSYKGVPEEYKKSFLEANFEAIGRKVIVERYFLIDKHQAFDKSTEHSKILSDVIRRHVDFLGDSINRMKVFFCPVENYTQEKKDDTSFAIIKNSECDSYMYLMSGENNDGPYIEMNVFDNNNEENYKRLHGKVEKYRNTPMSEKYSLIEVAQKLGIEITTRIN